MHRTEGTNNASNLFTNGPPATCVTDDWLNAVQEEIANVIEKLGVPLKTANTDTRDQLYNTLITRLQRYYVVDYTETDQGNNGNGRSAKDLIDLIGTVKSATLIFPHNSDGNTTIYTFSSDVTIPSNIKTVIENGSLLSIENPNPAYSQAFGHGFNSSLAVTFTINGPFEAGLYQVFSGAGTMSFGYKRTVRGEWWGALTSASAATNTSAFQAAIDSIDSIASGGTLKISDGTFTVDAVTMIILISNLKVEFQSRAAKLKAADTATNAVTAIFYAEGKSNIDIVGSGSLEGDRDEHTGVTGEAGMGIRFRYVKNANIEDMFIEDCWGDGINIADDASHDSCENINIRGCHVGDCRRHGISITGLLRGTISDCFCSAMNGVIGGEAGIDIEPGTSDTVNDVTVSNCVCTNNNGPGIAVGGSGGNVTGQRRIKLLGNTCKDNGGRGISFFYANESIIANNICKDNGAEGMKVSGSAATALENVTIEGNQLIGSTNDGIYIGESIECILKGNTCKDNGLHGIRLERLSNYCDNHQVEGNTCIANSQTTDDTYDNIHLANGSHNNLIADNTCRHGGGAKQPKYGISVGGTGANRTMINGNHLYNSGKTKSIFDASNDAIIQGNYGDEETITADAQTLQHWGVTYLDSSGGARTGTMPIGKYQGQQKLISMQTAGNNFDITITRHETNDNEVARFDAVDEYLLLIWTGTEWATVSNSCTFP